MHIPEYFKPSAKLSSDGYKKLATVQEHLHPSVLALSLFESMSSMSIDVPSNKAGRKKKNRIQRAPITPTWSTYANFCDIYKCAIIKSWMITCNTIKGHDHTTRNMNHIAGQHLWIHIYAGMIMTHLFHVT